MQTGNYLRKCIGQRMIKLLDILYEVFDSYYPVKNREMYEPGREGQDFQKKRIAVFHGEGKKFIIEVYECNYHFYYVAYYPKLNRDFVKNKYRIQLNLKNQFKVLGTVFNFIKESITGKDPLASIGFFGAPDLEDNDPNYTTYMSKRYKIYLNMIKQFKLDHNCKIIEDPNLSAFMLVNKTHLQQEPNLLPFMSAIMEKIML